MNCNELIKLIAFIDDNEFQLLGIMSETKWLGKFGWD